MRFIPYPVEKPTLTNPSSVPNRNITPWVSSGFAQQINGVMGNQLLNADFRKIRNLFHQHFHSEQSMEANIANIASLIQIPIRYIKATPQCQFEFQEFGGKLTNRHIPSISQLNDLLGKPVLGFFEYFKDTREINFFNLTGRKIAERPNQSLITIGHELFHTLQEQDGIGSFDTSENPAKEPASQLLSRLYNEQRPDFLKTERILSNILGSIKDVSVLQGVFQVAQIEFQAHTISQELCQNLGDAEAYNLETEKKARYAIIAQKVSERLYQLLGRVNTHVLQQG